MTNLRAYVTREFFSTDCASLQSWFRRRVVRNLVKRMLNTFCTIIFAHNFISSFYILYNIENILWIEIMFKNIFTRLLSWMEKLQISCMKINSCRVNKIKKSIQIIFFLPLAEFRDRENGTGASLMSAFDAISSRKKMQQPIKFKLIGWLY